MRTERGAERLAQMAGDPFSDGRGPYSPGYIMAFSTNDEPFDKEFLDEIKEGALVRAPAVYAHINGSGSYLLTRCLEFDHNQVIHKVGVFNGQGELVWVDELDPPLSKKAGEFAQVVELVSP
jgi:hypothetical protein